MITSAIASSDKIQTALTNLGIPDGFIAYDTVPLLRQLVVALGNVTTGGGGVTGSGVVTGGGTIATGGFTFTVPATGTAALLETANIFTAAQKVSYDGTANNYIQIGATSNQIVTFNTSALGTGMILVGDNTGGGGGSSIRFGATGYISWQSTNRQDSGSQDTFIYRKAAATIQMGADAAGVTNQMLTAANRITSDGVGANLTIAPGNGRGGAGGSLIFSTFTTGAAGVAGTLTPRVYIDGPTGLMQFGGQTNSHPALKGTTDILQVRAADDSGYLFMDAASYYVGGTPGVTAGPFTSITSITVVGGIVTDIQGS